MTYGRFEELPVWRAAMAFANQTYSLLEDRAFDRLRNPKDQLERASLSISNNIAEGFERGSTAELLYFIYVARGSAGESRSILHFLHARPAVEQWREDIATLIKSAENISKQLRGWAESLQNSDIAGQRHLNDQSRGQYQQAKKSAEFLEKLRRLREGE
jgi:four helix bundle protein